MEDTLKAASLVINTGLLPSSPVSVSTGQRSIPPSLGQNAIWTIAGNSIYAASQWLQIAILAHLGTSVDVGQYALAAGFCAPVFMLFNLQLRQIQATDATNRHPFEEYLRLRIITSAAAFLTIVVFASFVRQATSTALLTAVLAVFKVFESISDIYQGLLQQHERLNCTGRSYILKGTLVFSLFGLIYISTHNLLWAITGMAFAQLISLFFYDIPTSHRNVQEVFTPKPQIWFQSVTNPRWELKALTKLAYRAFPLGLTMMMISLYANLPRFVLNKYVGPAGVGIFAAITYMSSVGALIVNAVGNAVSPRLSKYASQGNESAFWKLVIRLLLIAAAFGIGGVGVSLLFGHNLLQMLYGEEYARQSRVLTLLMLAAGLGYVNSIFGFATTAQGRFAGQPWAMAFTTVILLTTSFLLVPRLGLVGAALSVVVASVTSVCTYTFLAVRKDAKSV